MKKRQRHKDAKSQRGNYKRSMKENLRMVVVIFLSLTNLPKSLKRYLEQDEWTSS